jgi:hypothetical protein
VLPLPGVFHFTTPKAKPLSADGEVLYSTSVCRGRSGVAERVRVRFARSRFRVPSFAATHQPTIDGGDAVSIVRVGLAETKKFAEGYEAIFGKKKDKKETSEEKKPADKKKKKDKK